jgi:hypothetical protein
MSVDDNFQFGIDFFLITVVIHQILFGTVRSAEVKTSQDIESLNTLQ